MTGGAGAMHATTGALGLPPMVQAVTAFPPPQRSDFTLTGQAAATTPGAGCRAGTVAGPVPSLSEVFASGAGRYSPPSSTTARRW